jgi:hypothetical protein
MTTLAQSLFQHDFGHIRIVAQLWGIELNAKDRKEAQKELGEKMLNPILVREMLEALPPEAKHAIAVLQQNQGKTAWDLFTRQFGEIREMGIGKRDREKPYLNPVSVTETLFYRAFLARAFFDTPSGAQEFAYIPSDLLNLIEQPSNPPAHQENIFGRPARPEEHKKNIIFGNYLLDDLTTYLAALRQGFPSPPPLRELSPRCARDLMLAARLISERGEVQPDAVKSFLEADRKNAQEQIVQAWQKSETFNELWLTPELLCEGEWRNPVLDTRKHILHFLKPIPQGKWWSLKAFIADIKEHHPDFQRKAGEYDAWFIRRSADKTPLRGFEHWDEVEGALIRYFITNVLYQLGFVELATPAQQTQITAFRRRENKLPLRKEDGEIIATSGGKITISRFAPRSARYLISRFCDWEESKNPDEYRYQISASSLTRARKQNLQISHLLGLLKKFATTDIPPSLMRALRRWELNGTEARVEQTAILRLSKPEDLRALRKSRAGRFLGEMLNPTTVVIKEGASQKIMATLIEMGIFTAEAKQ